MTILGNKGFILMIIDLISKGELYLKAKEIVYETKVNKRADPDAAIIT